MIECGCESQDHADIVRLALEYIDLLENYIQSILVRIDNIEKNTEKLLALQRKEPKTATEINDEVNSLIMEYKALEEKSEMLWEESALDKYVATLERMGTLENKLRIRYNYDVIKGCVIDEA